MHMPVTVCFIDYAFNENIHKYCFHEWDVFLIYLFLWQTQKLSNESLLNLEKKETFASVISNKICYVACMINHIGKLIYPCTCLHEHDHIDLLIDKPGDAICNTVLSSMLLVLLSTVKVIRYLVNDTNWSWFWTCACSPFGGVNSSLKKVTWTLLVYDTRNSNHAINKITCCDVSCYILWTTFIQYFVNICMIGIDFWNITPNNTWHSVGCICVMISVITFFLFRFSDWQD